MVNSCIADVMNYEMIFSWSYLQHFGVNMVIEQMNLRLKYPLSVHYRSIHRTLFKHLMHHTQ